MMPELTAIHFGLLALMSIIGVVWGWILHADRCAKERIALSARWQERLKSQQAEHNRLAGQNKNLMEQISQYQASQKDYSNRAKELSDALKEAFARRDDLQRQIKEVRGKLESSVTQREKLQFQLSNGQLATVREKDNKIFHLSRELTSWQNRVPPLVDRFRERDAEAQALENELNKTRSRLQGLEDIVKLDHNRIKPLDAKSLPDCGDASNEPVAITGLSDAFALQDQIDGGSSLHELFDDDSVASTGNGESLDDSSFAAIFSEVRNTTEDSAGNASPLAEVDGLVVENNDDLKMIKGIGPSIEKTLHDLGIFRFHQIAEMSEYDIDRVAQQLRGFSSRIYREDWIGQARNLQLQQNNGED